MRRFLLLFAFTICSFSLLKAQTTIHSENFSTNTSGSWTAVDISGPTDQWRFNVTPGGFASINGFGDENDEDWLVSPAIDMNAATGETFTFTSRTRFSGPLLELYYTTNYTTVAGSTWTALPLTLPVNTTNVTQSFTQHANIDVSAISGTAVRFAFKYYGTSTLTKEWQIDDIVVSGFTTCTTPTNAPSSITSTPSSTSATINWAKGDGTNTLVYINTQDVFTDPVDGTTYTANTVYGGSGAQVVSNGTGNSVTVTGLTGNTTYYVRLYNFSGCSSPIDYFTTSWGATTLTTQIGCPTITGSGTEPVGYYTAADGLTCQSKMNALRSIISNCHTDQGYSGLWTVYATSDVRPGTNNIWDMYTDKADNTYCASCPLVLTTDQDGGSGGAVECDKYNREHTIPQSWFNDASPMRNDPHHVTPADKKVNNVRGNDPYGVVDGSPTYTSCNGSKFGNSTGAGGVSGTVFEPIDEYKGDFARIYFYMATRYNDVIGNWASNTTEAGKVIAAGGYKAAYMQMLYQWHQNDPVSAKETARNNAIYVFQGNRNPYIDHPEYVLQVWSCVLPVTLTAFKGIYNDNKVTLDWTAENEVHFSHYEIERQNTEGGNFEVIGTVKAKQLRQYNFDDTQLATVAGRWAKYRLRLVNLDGTYEFSKTISIELPNKRNSITLYPNPAYQTVTLTLGDAFTGFGNVEVTDLLGKVWFTQTVSTPNPTYDFGHLPNGCYHVRMTLNGATYQQRLVIAH
jgi:endonuclease I